MRHVKPPVAGESGRVYGSPKWMLAREDIRRVAIGAGVAGAGALLTYVAEHGGDLDFGDWTPAVVAFLSVLVNVLRKYLSDTTFKY